MKTPKADKSRRNQLSLAEILVFLVPLLFFIIILYGTLLWTIYVSFTDWKTVAEKFSPSVQLVTAHTKHGDEFYSVRVSARTAA